MTDLPDQILALINTITQNNVKNTGPQVVHGGWYVSPYTHLDAVIAVICVFTAWVLYI